MNAFWALVPVRSGRAKGVAVRQVLCRKSTSAAVGAALPFDFEALEGRRLLSGGFGDHGWTHATFADYSQYAGGLPTYIGTGSGGAIYVGGEVWDGVRNALGIARFNADGSPDGAFGTAGTVAISTADGSSVDRIVTQADGKLIVIGETDTGLEVVRLNTDGSVDTSYGGGLRTYGIFDGVQPGAVTDENVTWLDSSGKLVITAMQGPNIVTLRLTTDGHPDSSFADNGFVSVPFDTGGDPIGCDRVLGGIPQADGSVNAYVATWTDSSTELMYKVKIDASGQVVSQKVVDVGLSAGTDFAGDYPPDYVIVFGADGSAYVSTQANDSRVAKLTPDGQLDATFGDGGIVTLPGWGALVQGVTPDGGVIVQAGQDDPNIFGALDPCVKLNADGSTDSSFGGGATVGTSAYPAFAMGDGSTLFAYFGGYDATGNSLGASFVLQKIGGSSTDDGATSDTTALATMAYQNSGQYGTYEGLFATPTGVAVWNPTGDQEVYADPITV